MYFLKLVFKLILLISVLLINKDVTAQLKIAKDNVQCGYGLKDSLGKWVIEPSYVDLYKKPQFYIAFDGQYYGMLDTLGKIILPLEYQYNQYDPQVNSICFLSKNGKKGIVNSLGKIIFPFQYDNIQIIKGMENSHFLLYEKDNGKYTTSYANENGEFYFKKIPGYAFPTKEYGSNKYFKVCEFPVIEMYNGGKFGIVDSIGKLIIPMQWQHIYLCENNTFTVIQNGKTGLLNQNNQFILKPEYTLSEMINKDQLTCISEQEIYCFKDSTKFGVIKGNGHILLPSVYDKIESVNKETELTLSPSYLDKNKQMGLVSSEGKIIVEPTLQRLELFPYPTPRDYSYPSVDYYNSSWYYKTEFNQIRCYFFYKQKNHFGIMSNTGKKLTEPIYDTIIANGSHAYFFKGTNIQSFELYNIPEEEKGNPDFLPLFDNVKFLSQTDSIFLYNYNSQTLCFIQQQKNGRSFMSYQSHNFGAVGKSENLHTLMLDQKTYIFNREGKSIGPDFKFRFINPPRGYLRANLPIIELPDGRKNIMNAYDGSLILDSFTYQNFDLRNMDKNAIFISDPKKDTIIDQIKYPQWKIIDTTGKLRTASVFNSLPNLSVTTSAFSNGYYGFLSPDLKWVTPPVFKQVRYIYEPNYIVQTKDNHFGIISNSNVFLVDTIYSRIIPVYSKRELNSYHSWWLFENEDRTERVLYCTTGKTIMSYKNKSTENQQINQLLKALSIEKDNGSSSGFQINNLAAPGASIDSIPLFDEIYRRCYLDYSLTLPCLIPFTSEKNTTLQQTPCKEKVNDYTLLSQGKSFFTLRSGFKFESVIWIRKSPRVVTRSDIFGSKNNFQEQLIKAIQARDDLDLDCSTPELMVEQIGEQFYLTNEGVVVLLFDNKKRKMTPIVITIDILSSHKKSKRIIRYLTSGKRRKI